MTQMPVSSPDTQESPLQRLSRFFASDMDAVNARIISNMQADIDLIPKIAGYLIASGGKRIRPLMTLAATRLYGEQDERAFGLAACVEFIHTATLLHDDVVDESEQRRGRQTANLVFGNQASVLVGDFLFSRAFQLMVADGSLPVLKVLSDASAIIAQGEVLQLITTNNVETTLSDYLRVADSKTAALFAAACEVGPLVAGQDAAQVAALREYGRALGIAFQMVDDVLDYSATQEKLGKTVGDDYAEGKMTLPVILALERAAGAARAFLEKTYRGKNPDPSGLAGVQAILRDTQALERGMDMARDYAQKARQALAAAPKGPVRDMLGDLATFTVERDF